MGYAIADARLGFISTAATHESPVDVLDEATGGQTELMPCRKSANLEPLSNLTLSTTPWPGVLPTRIHQ